MTPLGTMSTDHKPFISIRTLCGLLQWSLITVSGSGSGPLLIKYQYDCWSEVLGIAVFAQVLGELWTSEKLTAKNTYVDHNSCIHRLTTRAFNVGFSFYSFNAFWLIVFDIGMRSCTRAVMTCPNNRVHKHATLWGIYVRIYSQSLSLFHEHTAMGIGRSKWLPSMTTVIFAFIEDAI